MTKYREPCSKPCAECPFRRKALPGYLGDAPPEGFISDILAERPLPCHMSIDYDDPRWLRKWNAGETGKTCAGSLIMAANMCKVPRDKEFPRKSADTKTVFSHPKEFLDFHNGADVRSWVERFFDR